MPKMTQVIMQMLYVIAINRLCESIAFNFRISAQSKYTQEFIFHRSKLHIMPIHAAGPSCHIKLKGVLALLNCKKVGVMTMRSGECRKSYGQCIFRGNNSNPWGNAVKLCAKVGRGHDQVVAFFCNGIKIPTRKGNAT